MVFEDMVSHDRFCNILVLQAYERVKGGLVIIMKQDQLDQSLNVD